MRSLPVVAGLLLALAAVQADAQPLAVIVAPQNAAQWRLERAGLALIFQRKQQFDARGRRLQPVNLPPDDPARIAFSRAVFALDPAALDEYWRERYFHGVRPPYVVGSHAAMLRFVATTPAAIGYLPVCALDDSVAVVGYLDEQGRWRRQRPDTDCTSAIDPPPVSP